MDLHRDSQLHTLWRRVGLGGVAVAVGFGLAATVAAFTIARSSEPGSQLKAEWTFGETITLPTDGYMPLYADVRGVRYEAAVDRALASCVTERGVALQAPDRGSESGLKRDLHARRYGVVDPGEANVWGYGPAPDPIAEAIADHNNGLSAEQLDAVGTPEDPSSCLAEVHRSVGLYGDRRWDDLAAVVDLQQASFLYAQDHPEVQAANRRWSSCLEASTGYEFPTVVAATVASAAGEFGDRDVEVARADIDCKKSTGVVGVYIAAETEYQHDLIEQNSQVFDRALSLQQEMFAWTDAKRNNLE